MMKVVVDLDLRQWLDDAQLGEIIADEVRQAVRAEVRKMTKDAISAVRLEWMKTIQAKVKAAGLKVEPV